MRVLHVVTPAAYGGAQSVVARITAGAAESGRPVHVVTLMQDPAAGSFVAELSAAGVAVTPVAAGPRAYRAEARAVAGIAQAWGADAIHTHIARADLVGWLASRTARTALVATVHGHPGGNWSAALSERIDRYLLRRFDAVVCVSDTVHGLMRTSGCPAALLHTVVNGSGGPAALPRDAARAALGIECAGPVLGWVGRIAPEKGPDLLIEVIAALPRRDVSVVVIGDGPMRDSVRRLAGERGVEGQVRFAGPQPASGKLMAAFDCLVVSSRSEGSPMVVLEALQAGTPVAAFDVGGIRNLVGSDCYLAPPQDVGALAGAIARVLDDPVRARETARRAGSAAEARFGMTRWLAELDAVYRAALSRRDRRLAGGA